jgi:hypothetical protein
MDEVSVEKVNKIFKRLRARLYNQIESAGLSSDQCKAMKQAIKDYTSHAWNDIVDIDEKK